MSSNPFVVGNIISIEGLRVTAMMHDNTNLLNYYYDGEYYSGVGIGTYIGIIRGPFTIIGKVEKEFLEDSYNDISNQEYGLDRFKRLIELKIIGKFNQNNDFVKGLGTFPLIYDEVVLLTEKKIQKIIQGNSVNHLFSYAIGNTVNEEIAFNLPWNNIFNTHIGIFGNTGSGKSNTLAKIYTELFSLNDSKVYHSGISQFVFIDFNGEYTRKDVLTTNKKTLKLSTSNDTSDKIRLSEKQFWDTETLSILFSATEKTQQPFLKNAINYYVIRNNYNISKDSIIEDIGKAFYNVFRRNNNKESLGILRNIFKKISFDSHFDNRTSNNDVYVWLNANWHSANSTYYNDDSSLSTNFYMSQKTEQDINNNRDELIRKLSSEPSVDSAFEQLTLADKLSIFTQLRLIFNLASNYSQFDHISPLIERIESRSNIIDRLIEINNEKIEEEVIVISLGDCNQEAKKVIPLLITKQFYREHKTKILNESGLNKTVHLIIDEAHNILSESSNREESTWKDYRLEVFEEIIKEGRKFGFYVTISSQRPSDISPTIISQIHNFFIHRLVNEQDLKMIGNTINSLDILSRRNIPELGAGQCVVTGTSFDMPIIIKVDQLPSNQTPDSENANLERIWSLQYHIELLKKQVSIESIESLIRILDRDNFLISVTLDKYIPNFNNNYYLREIIEHLHNEYTGKKVNFIKDIENSRVVLYKEGEDINKLLPEFESDKSY
ncbi:ATP-binding protein [Ruoffia tabacinasalis]|uniref:ATP-binding protein n=1 Tax=Ruoffia tabacinasalis TaxID=87458 RepID=A0ABS0LLY4_9LACT|nr:DUF87 domain-containing protein [Ruoffia tabacinasalis]MBG9979305.1 ATP-binding protein [Ruoffia tabacinasalis]